MSGNGRSSNKVGFKKPPKHSQFKKGRSGNPHGRPKEYDAAAERRQLSKRGNISAISNAPQNTAAGRNRTSRRITKRHAESPKNVELDSDTENRKQITD